jgi:hypothetical protein
MRRILFVAAAATSLVAAAPAFAAPNTDPDGGYAYGPMGQCFDARVCGDGRNAFGAYAFAPFGHGCQMVRERVVTESGHVFFRRHRVCD